MSNTVLIQAMWTIRHRIYHHLRHQLHPSKCSLNLLGNPEEQQGQWKGSRLASTELGHVELGSVIYENEELKMKNTSEERKML